MSRQAKNRVLTIRGQKLFALEKVGIDKRIQAQFDCDYIDMLKSRLNSSNAAIVKEAEEALIFMNNALEAVYRSDYRPLESQTGKKIDPSVKKTINSARTSAQQDVMNARSHYRSFDCDLSIVPDTTEAYDDSPGFEIVEARVKLGKKIESMRKSLGLSRSELSRISCVSEAKLFRIEHGKPIQDLVELLPKIQSVIGEIKFT